MVGDDIIKQATVLARLREQGVGDASPRLVCFSLLFASESRVFGVYFFRAFSGGWNFGLHSTPFS